VENKIIGVSKYTKYGMCLFRYKKLILTDNKIYIFIWKLLSTYLNKQSLSKFNLKSLKELLDLEQYIQKGANLADFI